MDLEIEKVRFANEIKNLNPEVLEKAVKIVSGQNIEFIPHTDFKELSAKSKAIIRTGEATPYANVILQSGCTFKV